MSFQNNDDNAHSAESENQLSLDHDPSSGNPYNLKRRISDLVQDYNWSPEYFPTTNQTNSGLLGNPSISDIPHHDYSNPMGYTGASQIPSLSNPVLPTKSTVSSQGTNLNVKKPVKRITGGKHKRNASSGPPKRPAFILKLWTMVNDPKNQDYIQWTPEGDSFKVSSKENFEKIVLPKYFKHSNYSSFVRQLNMYGWHKVQDITAGAMQSGDEVRQFKSPYFIRGREDLLDSIVRNKTSKGSDDEDESDLGKILDELDLIKSNQLEIAADLNRIRQDNQLLWRECYESREKHKTHAETFERILRFLASLYANNQGKFVNDSVSPFQRQQRLLLPNLSELDSGQIADLSSQSNIPVSEIEELMSNDTPSGPSYIPSRSNRISTVSSGDQASPVRTNPRISEALTPQSTETSPNVTRASETPDEHNTSNAPITFNQNIIQGPQYSDLGSAQMVPNHDSLSTLQPGNNYSSSSHITTSSPNAAFPEPSSFQVVSPTTKSENYVNSLDSSDMKSEPAIPASAPLTGSNPSQDFTSFTPDATSLAPLVSDALYDSNQNWLDDNKKAQHLLHNSQDIDSIVRNINYQGDSLDRIQDQLHRYVPYKDPSVAASPQIDPSFDVYEFLQNVNTDLIPPKVDPAIDSSTNQRQLSNLDSSEDLEPPNKRPRMEMNEGK